MKVISLSCHSGIREGTPDGVLSRFSWRLTGFSLPGEGCAVALSRAPHTLLGAAEVRVAAGSRS